jgi:hypothetical protein
MSGEVRVYGELAPNTTSQARLKPTPPSFRSSSTFVALSKRTRALPPSNESQGLWGEPGAKGHGLWELHKRLLKGHGLWGKKEYFQKGHVFYLDDMTLSTYNRPLNGAVHA